MPLVPALQILFRRKDDILFGWNVIPKTQVKSYNLYSCATSAGAYSLVKKIVNARDTNTPYKGKTVAFVKDSDIPIPSQTNYWFKLTIIDSANVESNINDSTAIVVYPQNVEPFFENEDEIRNTHNMAWIESRHRWEKILLTDDGRLKTDAIVNIDEIQLGNVKVAQKPDGTTLDYMLIDDNRKLIVRQDPDSISRIAAYNEISNIVKNVESVLLTYTNIVAYFVEKIVCSGTADAVFKMKIDGNTVRTIRNAWNDRNAIFDFSSIAKKIPAGSTITITIEHTEKTNHKFEASLEGFTFTI
jgi:hypothetical protein